MWCCDDRAPSPAGDDYGSWASDSLPNPPDLIAILSGQSSPPGLSGSLTESSSSSSSPMAFSEPLDMPPVMRITNMPAYLRVLRRFRSRSEHERGDYWTLPQAGRAPTRSLTTPQIDAMPKIIGQHETKKIGKQPKFPQVLEGVTLVDYSHEPRFWVLGLLYLRVISITDLRSVRRRSRLDKISKVCCKFARCDLSMIRVKEHFLDPFVTVDVFADSRRMWRLTVTPNKRNTNNPVFNHDCSTIIDFEVPDVPGVLEEATWRGVGQGRRVEQLDPNAVDLPGGPTIILGVWDRHYRRSAKGSRPLGYVRLSIKDILGASFKSDVVRRQVTHHATQTAVGAMKLAFKFVPFSGSIPRRLHNEVNLGQGDWVASPSDLETHDAGSELFFVPESPVLPTGYFPHREANGMRLYHDADRRVGDAAHSGSSYWEDLYDVLSDAKYFIFIAGWSINIHVRLGRRNRSPHMHAPAERTTSSNAAQGCDCGRSKRQRKDTADLCEAYWDQVELLGELLKRKAAEGVTVVLLIWNDPSSTKVRKEGLMGTADEETRRFFRNTGVKCKLLYRYTTKSGFRGSLSNIFAKVTYTHHQKIVCVDAEIQGLPGPVASPFDEVPKIASYKRRKSVSYNVKQFLRGIKKLAVFSEEEALVSGSANEELHTEKAVPQHGVGLGLSLTTLEETSPASLSIPRRWKTSSRLDSDMPRLSSLSAIHESQRDSTSDSAATAPPTRLHRKLARAIDAFRERNHYSHVSLETTPRGLACFLGGIDLTVGRYDTPDHELFGHFWSHKRTFYNMCTATSRRLGPRQPWHDIHCQIGGQAAFDVLQNVLERVEKQSPSLNYHTTGLIRHLLIEGALVMPKADFDLYRTKRHRFVGWAAKIGGRRNVSKEPVQSYETARTKTAHLRRPWQKHGIPRLLPEEMDDPSLVTSLEARALHDALSPVDDGAQALSLDLQESTETVQEDDRWHMQVFRSIDAASATFVNDDFLSSFSNPRGAVQRDIHWDYIYQIGRAKRFVYIENQYFIGSSQWWGDTALRRVRCRNSVPWTIASKIVEKIRQRVEFTVYVVLPLHSEGHPDDSTIQEILFWQRMTVATIYQRIASALDAQYLDPNEPRPLPTDYFQLFFLGTKEPLSTGGPQAPVPRNTPLQSKFRRHIIYCHSKLMIVDDEYLLLGSANINERSLNGHRDSEIAVGAWQESHRCELVSRLPGNWPRSEDRRASQVVGLEDVPVHKKKGVIRDRLQAMKKRIKRERWHPANTLGSLPGAGSAERDTSVLRGFDIVLPKGEVAAFRTALFDEHFGGYHPEFEDPGASLCSGLTRRLAEANWEAYIDTAEPDFLPHGHAMLYPYNIHSDGFLTSKSQTLPDAQRSVLGAKTTLPYSEEITT